MTHQMNPREETDSLSYPSSRFGVGSAEVEQMYGKLRGVLESLDSVVQQRAPESSEPLQYLRGVYEGVAALLEVVQGGASLGDTSDRTFPHSSAERLAAAHHALAIRRAEQLSKRAARRVQRAKGVR